jgi:hypothetical protein
MTSQNNKFWDIATQKVNIRQYLPNKLEPAEAVSGKSTIELERQSGVIKDTQTRKNIIRNLASKLRIRNKR